MTSKEMLKLQEAINTVLTEEDYLIATVHGFNEKPVEGIILLENITKKESDDLYDVIKEYEHDTGLLIYQFNIEDLYNCPYCERWIPQDDGYSYNYMLTSDGPVCPDCIEENLKEFLQDGTLQEYSNVTNRALWGISHSELEKVAIPVKDKNGEVLIFDVGPGFPNGTIDYETTVQKISESGQECFTHIETFGTDMGVSVWIVKEKGSLI